MLLVRLLRSIAKHLGGEEELEEGVEEFRPGLAFWGLWVLHDARLLRVFYESHEGLEVSGYA
jgi:hypothetical protein